MLSIHDLGSLGAGGANAAGAEQYYQQTTAADRQSHDLPTAPEGMSEGITYAFGPYAPADLREGARLTRDDIRDMLRGEWRGQAVQNAHGERRFMGWDCTFSAPKSLSVAYAVAGPETRAKIEDAVIAAARKTIDEVLRPEMYARVGHGGRERIDVSPISTLYLQRNSRANDPQLHVHATIPSFAYGADGRVHAVEFGEVYRSKMAGGAGFQLELAHEREERAGLRMYRGEDGKLRIEGISRDLEDYYSKRSEQIDAKLGPDAYNATAAQRAAATIASRPAHDRDYREDWVEQAKAAGLERDWQRALHAVEQALERRREGTERLSAEERARILDDVVEQARKTVTIGGTSAVTGKELAGSAVVEQRQLLAESATRAVGTGASLDEVREAVDRAIRRGHVVELEAGDTPLGRKITTPEMVALERRLVENWRGLLDERGHGVAPTHVEQAIREWEHANVGKTFSPEQRAAVAAMTADRGAALIEGLAGTGKTEALSVARHAYELAGYTVVGESYSGAAASELQKSAGIVSRTTASAEVHGRPLNAHTVVVVDEAARATSPQLDRLVGEAKEAGAKVVLTGDPHQLQPIGPGNAFPHLAQDVHERAPEASAQIQDIRRQEKAAPEVREVAELAARGQAGDALKRAEAHGMVSVHATADDMRRAAATEIADALQQGKTALGITATREDAGALNKAVRPEFRERNVLSATEQTYTATKMRRTLSVALSEGDRVAFKHNDYSLGVRNGWSGEVVGISRTNGTVTVCLDSHVRTDRDGRVMRDAVVEARQDGALRVHDRDAERYVSVPRDKVARVLGHDYARTADRAQGATVDHAVVTAHADSKRMDRQWGAVAFTRQREGLSVHLSAEGMERPEQRQATYEQAHWPRPGLDGQEPHQNAIREAREQRDEARQAMQEARQTWHQARDDLRQARRDFRDARAAGDAERVAAAKESVAAIRGAERAAHADYRDAKERCREAREHARETWAEAKAAARGQAEERERTRPGSAVQEQQPVSREAKAEAVRAAAKQLDRDRPGSSTLDYQHSQELAAARGTDRRENILGERAAQRTGRDHDGLGHAR
jgi:conjugative relaxase-like TrwC/TraI family protein